MSASMMNEKVDLEILNKPLKDMPAKGLSPIYPINGRGGYCSSPSSVRYYLICGSNLDLFDVEGLVSKFEFFLTNWFIREKKAQRISSKKYRKCLDMLLANLRYAHLEGKQILCPTAREKNKRENPENIGYQVVNNTLEFLAERGFIRLVRGVPSEVGSPCTWCEPTAPLVAIFERHGVYSKLNSKTRLVELRTRTKVAGVKRALTLDIPTNQKRRAAQLALPAKIYNELWSNHLPTLEGRYILPWCRRVFNDSFDYGGRFYGTYQQLPRVERDKLLIDGEPTTEPDYNAFHINIIYSWERLQLSGDPYQIEGFCRSTVKAIMLPLLNTENIPALIGHINKSARPIIKEQFQNWKAQRIDDIQSLALGVRNHRPSSKPNSLKGFIYGIPEGTNGEELISSIKAKHWRIAHHFGTSRIGVRLQNADSEIMSSVLTKLCSRNIPVLPVHDSLRCKVSDVLEVVEVMKSEYKKVSRFDVGVSIDERRNSKIQQRLEALRERTMLRG